ncbi:MAG: hypothetical protein SOW61_00825 [Erysipelotrichaceae bacterium]|nr:hypothetical protein [Erysipelotrichaceae bacterium]
MKKILLSILLLISFILPTQCFAMSFSQPVQIGYASYDINRDGGYSFEGASVKASRHYSKIRKKITGYEKGIAIFNTNGDRLVIDFDMITRPGKCWVGDGQNYTEMFFLNSTISQFKGSNGMVFYASRSQYTYSNYVIFGKYINGKYAKYIDTGALAKQYYGNTMVDFGEMVVCTDGFIIPFSIWKKDLNVKGDFVFKWDEKANWFSVEKIVY